jgi:hypothetical protein
MIRFHCLCLAALLAFNGRASAAPAPETNFFPVMAWNYVPADAAVLKKMKECGLTVAGFVPPSALHLCKANGLKGIVWDPRTMNYDWIKVDDKIARSNVVSLVKKVGKHPAVYGYYLRDEPGPSLFPGLAKVSKLIHELAPGKWAYINLFPNYADQNQLEGRTYEKYVDEFVQTCDATVLSYDHYAILDNGALREGYWNNLEQMRNAAGTHQLPFWQIVLSVAHFNYREPSAADLRFEVYSSLAYGARGIAYFTYFTSSTGNYRMGPIDQFGNPTITWSHMQNVNLQIQKLAPTLLQLTSDDVYHCGNVPGGAHGPRTNDLLTGVNGGDFVVGDFIHADKSHYVIIVNKDVTHSVVCSPQYRTPPKRVKKLSAYTGGLIDFAGEDSWLAPGHGVVLRIE